MRKIRGWIMSEHDARSMLHQIEERIRSSKIEVQQSGCPDPTSFSDRGRPYDRVSGQTGNPAGARLISADIRASCPQHGGASSTASERV